MGNNNIHLSKMLCLSRDNPAVMKKVFRLLEDEVKAANNPKLIDAPCYLHPTHTAFKNGVKALKMNLVSLLGNLHGFFKTSSARREDMVELREELAEELQDQLEEVCDQFFLRHVDTRWLEAQHCIERLLDHWESTIEYFMVYLPNSNLQNNKLAIKSKKYKNIAVHLCQDEVIKTKIRCKFLVMLAKSSRTFLTLLQSEKPMIHLLQDLAFDMFSRLGNLVIRPENRPSKASKVKEVDLKNSSNLLPARAGGFLACCTEDLDKLRSEDRQDMRRELRDSLVAMLLYLQANLPWDKTLYTHLSFLDPLKRTATETPSYGVAVAGHLNRFTDEQKVNLSVLLNQCQALPSAQVRFTYTVGWPYQLYLNTLHC